MIARSILVRARSELMLNTVDPAGWLGAAAGSSDVTMVIHGAPLVNQVLEIDDELVVVTGQTVNNPPTYTVTRGVLGSTAAAHASGAQVRMGVRYPMVHLLNALRDEVAYLSSPEGGMWQMKTATLTSAMLGSDSRGTYWDVSSITDLLDPYSVDGVQQAIRHYDPAMKRIYVVGETTGTLHYRAEFGTVAGFTTDLTTIGLPATAEHLLVLGVQVRMLTKRTPRRVEIEVQPNPRFAEDAGPESVSLSLRSLLMEYERARRAEIGRLERRWPRRRRTGT